MSLSPFRSIISILTLSFVAATAAVAQSSDVHQHETGMPVACGTLEMLKIDREQALANTAKNDPQLYRKMLVAAKDGDRAPALMSDLGEIEQWFWVYDRTQNQFVEVVATLVFDGKWGRVWIDNADTARVKRTSTQMKLLFRSLDSVTAAGSRNPKKGIIENDVELFGAAPTTYEVDGKSDFLLTDIKDAVQGANVLGYFIKTDQSEAPESNRMNLLYIDSKEGLSSTTSLLNTIAHEYQHLIHFGRNPNSELFFNEGSSEAASIVTGYWNRPNSNYYANTNVDLISWPPQGTTDGTVIVGAYERAMTLIHFMTEQFGERFLYEFVGTRSNGLTRIDETLAKLGIAKSQTDATMVLRQFAVANYLGTSADPRYGYKVKVSTTKPKLAATFTAATLPTDNKVSLSRLGISYMQLTKPGPVKVRFTGTRLFRVMAMKYTGTNVEVQELEGATDYVLGASYDKVVLAFVNLTNNAQTITWSAAGVTLGVDDEVAVSGRLAFEGISPNPITESALVRFSTPEAGPIRLEIFSPQGRLVSTLLNGERYEAGRHEVRFDAAGLTSGYYMARLSQGDRTTTHVVIVTK